MRCSGSSAIVFYKGCVMMGFVPLAVVLLVCGARAVVVREWYVPFYGPGVSYSRYYSSYSRPLLSSYGNPLNLAGVLAPVNQVQFVVPRVEVGIVGGTSPGRGAQAGNLAVQSEYGTAQSGTGNGAVQSAYGTAQSGTGNGAVQSAYGTAQSGTGNGAVQSAYGTAQSGPDQTGNGAGTATAQYGNGANQSGDGASQMGSSVAQTGNGGGQTGGAATGDIWAGYTMYQASEHPALLEKVNAALQANGPELAATRINFGGSKTVGSESQTGPGTVSLVNFGSNANKNCYAYLIEPTGKTPEIPKESIACAA